MEFRFAEGGDVEAITRLINSAFQVERFFLDHDRISAAEVEERLRSGRFLLSEEAGRLVGCMYIEDRGERAYFGLISIAPDRQGAGLGKRLIGEAEEQCRALGRRLVELTVVNLRVELPPFCRKLGYAEDGIVPFPADQHPKLPCHLIRMFKAL